MKAVTFSYDDGVVQDIRLIELLNKYELKCTFNLNSELLGKKGMLDVNGQRVAHYKVAAEDVREIYEGHEVAVHTLTHPNLLKLDEEEIIRQIEQDRINLEKLVGYDIVGMAYPGGGNDDRVAEIIKNKTKIRYSRVVEGIKSFELQDNLYRFRPSMDHLADFERITKRINEFINLKPDKPQILYIWGHSYELDAGDGWSKIEEIFKLISGYDNIFYGTNSEILLK